MGIALILFRILRELRGPKHETPASRRAGRALPFNGADLDTA